VRRETSMSDYLNGGLRIINLDIKSKALLIGRVFRFLEENEAPWKDRVSHQFKKDEKINSLMYFKNYVRNRLETEQCIKRKCVFEFCCKFKSQIQD
jgi:hypothetical protein